MFRFIARRQVDRLASLGYAILTGIELEFMLLHQVQCFFIITRLNKSDFRSFFTILCLMSYVPSFTYVKPESETE